MDDGHRLASYDTSLVVSGGVDCRRRRRNVYDKKPRRYKRSKVKEIIVLIKARSFLDELNLEHLTS